MFQNRPARVFFLKNMKSVNESRNKFEGKSVGIVSLGCARNTVDSEKILLDVKRSGGLITTPDKASVIIVNTCAFTKDAKQESIDVILELLELKKKHRIESVYIYGCLPQRYPEVLKKEFVEADGFFGISDFKTSFDSVSRITPSHYAYLKICEGCVNLCSFCAIPKIKGKFRSRDEHSIFKEVEFLESSGVKELNIIGQDITMFGREKGFKSSSGSLAKLVKKILSISSIPWIRLLYLHPDRMEDQLIDLISEEERVCKYVDIPFQHINNRILKLMNRKTDKKSIMELISKLRSKIPGVALRSTFIVGFPSEKSVEFKELLDFLNWARFERLGAFVYSPEEGTEAAGMKGKISEKIKVSRFQELMSIQRSISSEIQRRMVNKEAQVLIDEKDKTSDDVYIGRTSKDAPEVDGIVFVKSADTLVPGDMVKVKISDSYEYDLTGEKAS